MITKSQREKHSVTPSMTTRGKPKHHQISTPTPTLGGGVSYGDQLGTSVAIHGDLALLGAPQPPQPNEPLQDQNAGDGTGYVYLRQVDPPGAKILPKTQEKLLEGATVNVIAGTLNSPPHANALIL